MSRGLGDVYKRQAFLELIEVFPNSYEVKKYVSSRISYLLSTYVEGVWKNKESYERYLEKKEANLPLSSFPNIKLMGYEMYKKHNEKKLKAQAENAGDIEE